MTVARNALHLLLGQAATTTLAILLSAALGRSLGAEEFGVYYLITTMSAFAYVFVEWGQPLVLIRQVARDPARSGVLLGTALALRVVVAVLMSLPVGLIAYSLGYGWRTTSLAVVLIVGSLGTFLSQGYGMVFRAFDRMGSEALVSVANKALALLLALAVLAAGWGVPGVVAAQALAGLAALALARRLHARLGAPPRCVSPAVARELLTVGTPVLAMTAAASVQPYLDVIVLSKLAPPPVLGWFGAARNVLGTLIAPAVILGAAAYPRLARASRDSAQLRQDVRAAFRPLLLLAALAGTGTYLFADAVIGLIYGSQRFGPAATIMKFFAPGLFLLFIDIFLGNVIYATGRGTGFAVAKVASVMVGTGLDFLLIPLFQQRLQNGGIGAVVAFALSEVVVFGGSLIVLRSRSTLDWATALDAARALAAATATLVLFRMIPPIPLGVGVPLCVGVFAAASLALGLLRSHDLRMVTNLIRSPRIDGAPAEREAH